MFSDSRCKNACKMLADLCPCFHQSPTRPNLGRSRVKVCLILCRLRTKLCLIFGCSRARLCPISFAPCPFPNLAGTLRDNDIRYGQYGTPIANETDLHCRSGALNLSEHAMVMNSLHVHEPNSTPGLHSPYCLVYWFYPSKPNKGLLYHIALYCVTVI